jgi:hypothetical protein
MAAIDDRVLQSIRELRGFYEHLLWVRAPRFGVCERDDDRERRT